MNKKYTLIFVLFINLFASAQVTKKIYYTQDWKVTQIQDSAAFYRIVEFDKNNKPDGEIKDYYITGEIERITDGAIKIDSADDRNSKFIKTSTNYYKSGSKQALIVRDDEGNSRSSIGWYPGGNLWFKVLYENGKRSGAEKFYYENGSVKTNIQYANGQRNGHAKWYYQDGEIKEEETYMNDSINGDEKCYYDKGNEQFTVPYVNGKKEGKGKWFYMNGHVEQEVNYADDKMTGIDKFFFDDGKVSGEVPYINGKRNGLAKWYYSYGTERSELPYADDKRNGEAKEYYANGVLKSENYYSNDSDAGTSKTYFESGKIMKEIPYVNHKINGTVKTYTENGNLANSVDFANGRINGSLIEYWSNTRVKRKDGYDNGKLVSEEKYDSNGVNINPVHTMVPSYSSDSGTTSWKLVSDPVFTIVQQMPVFPGKINDYLSEHITYPQTENENGIMGIVYVNFIVGIDGSIGSVKVLKGVPDGPGLDSEAVRVIRSMPKWSPGVQNGHPVRVSYNIPINFVINHNWSPDTVFTQVQKMPVFTQDIDEYLGTHIRYPIVEKMHRLTGTVYIGFVIEKDGRVTNVIVRKGVMGAPGLGDEGVRVIKYMPKWIPGRQNGIPVRVACTLPIEFLLN